MCIAIYKPKGVEIPNKETLNRCFNRNKDGAGFAIYRDSKINLHKGFMTFEDFYKSFMSYNPQKDEPIFIHFRIATHGLVDGGNTHPFPITDSFECMRKTDLVYDGKVLIHNGVFHYPNEIMLKYDSKGLASDTMIFSKILYEKLNKTNKNQAIENLKTLGLEESIAMKLVNNSSSELLDENISSQISFSKVAIMNEDGSVYKYGNWIEENGVFYSNRTFENYNYNYYGGYYNGTPIYQQQLFPINLYKKYDKSTFQKKQSVCDFCGELRSDCIECDEENICKDCLSDFDLGYCHICKSTYEKGDMASKNICQSCHNQGYIEEDIEDIDDYWDDYDDETNICLCCGQNFTKDEASEDSEICKKCYQLYK